MPPVPYRTRAQAELCLKRPLEAPACNCNSLWPLFKIMIRNQTPGWRVDRWEQNSTLDYDAYLYGDSHEGLEERPPIADAEPLDDPLNIDPDTRVRYFRNNIYPYAHRMNYQDYYRAKLPIQVELVRLQNWMKDTGERLIILFEGRDAAGKGGAIRRFMEHWNPRGARVVALDKPSGAEVGQWYFQRYIRHFPAAGEIVSLRPLVVQPRRRREGIRFLHRGRVRSLHQAGPAPRRDDRRERHTPHQALLLRQPARAALALRPARQRPPQAVEDQHNGPAVEGQVGRIHRR